MQMECVKPLNLLDITRSAHRRNVPRRCGAVSAPRLDDRAWHVDFCGDPIHHDCVMVRPEQAATAERIWRQRRIAPIRTEEGRKIRRAFVATLGHKLVSADYSQIELRRLAEIADIAQLKQAFRDGLDIHALTASEMFGVPVKGMPAEVRRRAKAINSASSTASRRSGSPTSSRSRARRPPPTSRSISSASPASAPTWTTPRRSPSRTAMC